MTKTLKSRAASFWVAVMTLGILGCLAGVAYTFYMIQQEAGQEGEYRLAADEMRLLSQQVAVNARESVALATAFLSPPFLAGQMRFLWSKKKRQPAAMFAALWATSPLWRLLL